MIRPWKKFKKEESLVRQPAPEPVPRSGRVPGTPRDEEFACLCADARYTFWERVGMFLEDRPMTTEVDEIARAEAREVQARFLAGL